MDLNQNQQDFERDRLAERVNAMERFFESFNIETLEAVGDTGKLRVKNISSVNGNVQQVGGKEIEVEGSLDDGSATNRYLVWNTTDEEWQPAALAHPAGSTDNRYLIWDAGNSKWVAGELAYPAGTTDNRFLTWDASNSKWIATELIHPAGDTDNPYLKWSVADSKYEKAAGTALDASTVDGHVLETYDNVGVKTVRWGYARMKNI